MIDKSDNISCEQVLHDIKTPLTIMYSSIRELERASKNAPEMREALETLKQNWLRILKLVTDAGDYQKLSLGLLLPKLGNYDIVALARNITESTKALTVRKDIRLTFETELSEKRMAIDKDIIDRILLNLLSNAIKFSHTNGEIKVGLTEKGGFAVITVRDNGVGIAAEHAAKVFEPHFFVESPKNKNGTGMGLFIVKQLVELLDGEISLEPVTAGTCVKLRLPCFVLEGGAQELKRYDDFYSDNMVQVELSDAHYKEVKL